MKRDRILIIGGNYFPELTGIGKYNTEMVDWLAQNDYECAVITTYPYYPYWKIQEPYTKRSGWYKKEKKGVGKQNQIIIYRCPHYVPSIPTGIRRVVSDLSFFFSAFLQIVRLLFRKKYDYVLVVAPPFQIGLLGLLYKKIKFAKLIYHIQDLQIDAAIELGMIKSKPVVKAMFGLEKFILRRADYVSSISDGMIQKIKAKYNRNVILFPNWADTTAFYPIKNNEAFKKQYDFLPTDKIIMYSGAIGEKQGLQSLLYSAKELQDAPFIKFIICGSGPYKNQLIEMARKMSLHNVFFLPLQPAEKFNQFLNMADTHLIMQKANDNELFLPSKLTTICAVGGLAVITASANTSLYNLVSKNNLGMLIEPENQAALTKAIKKSIFQDHTAIRKNAHQFATESISINKIVESYFATISKKTPKTSSLMDNIKAQENNKIPNLYVLQNTEAIHK